MNGTGIAGIATGPELGSVAKAATMARNAGLPDPDRS